MSDQFACPLFFASEFLEQYARVIRRTDTAPDPDLLVVRDAGDAQFVSKVKLSWVDPVLGLGIADILSDWQQSEIRAGDRVLY